MLGESLKVRANRFRESPETSLNVINRLYPRQHLSLHRLIDWSILKNMALVELIEGIDINSQIDNNTQGGKTMPKIQTIHSETPLEIPDEDLNHIPQELYTLLYLTTDLHLDPKNARENHDIQGIIQSIEEFGFLDPIEFQKETGKILAGHGRYKASLQMGLKYTPSLPHDLDDKSGDRYNLTNNALTDGSRWNKGSLIARLEEVGTPPGFDPDILQKLRAKSQSGSHTTPETLIDQSTQLTPQRDYVVILCDQDGGDQFEELKQLLGLQMVRRGGYKKGSQFDAVSLERVVEASRFLSLREKQI